MRFFVANIEVYTKKLYTRLNFEKYIDEFRAMDKIVKEIVQGGKMLACVGK